MSRLKIGPRLTLSFILVFLLMFIGSALGIWQYYVMGIHTERLDQVDGQLLNLLQLHNMVLTLQRDLQQDAQTQNIASFSARAQILRADLVAALENTSTELQLTTNDQAKRATVITQLEAISNTLPIEITTMIDLARSGDWQAVEQRLEDQLLQAERITGDLVNNIETQIALERQRTLEDIRRTKMRAMTVTVATGMVGLWVAGLLGYLVTHSIVNPLKDLDTGAKALASGSFDYQVKVSGNDELANLGRVFNDTATQLARFYNRLEVLVQQRTEELHYRALQLETSIAVGQSMTSILDLDGLLNQVVNLIQSQYNYHYVGIFLLNEQKQCLVARAGATENGKFQIQQDISIRIDENSLIGRATVTRRSLFVNDVTGYHQYHHITALPETKSECAIPLEMGGELLGILDIQSTEVGHFGADDLPVIELLANQVSIAIHNAFLYESEKSRRLITERLYRVGLALSGTLDLSEVLDLILNYLLEIVPYDRGAVMLCSGDVLEFVAALGFPPEVNPLQLRISLHKGDVYDDIYRTQRPLYIPDISKRLDWQHVDGLPEARVWLGIPLIHSGEVIGMVSLVREIPRPYTEDEITLGSTFAAQAAIALQNARLYDRITRPKDNTITAEAARL